MSIPAADILEPLLGFSSSVSATIHVLAWCQGSSGGNNGTVMGFTSELTSLP